MAINIIMPSGGQTTDESMIARWLKKIGDPVKKGEVLFEAETDKATLAVESYAEGFLIETRFAEGEYATSGEIVAVIGSQDEITIVKGQSLLQIHSVKADESFRPAISPLHTLEIEDNLRSQQKQVEEDAKSSIMSDQLSERILMSPKARKAAMEHAINLADLSRVFPDQTINVQHIQAYLQKDEQIAYKEFDDVAVSQIRKTIARRMADIAQKVPQYQLSINIDMTEIIKMRRLLNQQSITEKNTYTVTYNDQIIYLVSRLVSKYPMINASFMGECIRIYKHVHFGLAVSLTEGILVPVIHNADIKSIPQISIENRENILLAKAGKFSKTAQVGGTMTLSSLGSFGIHSFTAIVNQPESVIFATGAIIEQPVVINGIITVRPIMNLTASFDHRLIDGAYAASFMKELKAVMETPCISLLYEV